MLLSGYRGAVTLLVPSHSGPTHPQSGNQVPVTLERGMGRESGLPLPPSKEADRNKAGRGLTRGDVRMGPQTSYLGKLRGSGTFLWYLSFEGRPGLLLPSVPVITCHRPGPQEDISKAPLEANDGSAASWPWEWPPQVWPQFVFFHSSAN